MSWCSQMLIVEIPDLLLDYETVFFILFGGGVEQNIIYWKIEVNL